MTVQLRLGSASFEPIRRTLLQRLANDLAVARELNDNWASPLGGTQPCCWIEFTMRDGPRTCQALHRICPDSCPHWHHQTEVFLA